ncbi:MAG: TolC family protein [Proteobacteria bacterium]|nr:TolC family protein [Pseudomonadota bacterium]
MLFSVLISKIPTFYIQAIQWLGACLFLLLSFPAYATCHEFKNSQDVLDCAFSSHPLVLAAKAKALQGEALEALASQRPNPEFDTNVAFGQSQGVAVVNSQTTLAHTFELGSKRGSRIEKAQAENEMISTDVLKAKEEVAQSVVPTLFRLRQVHGEIKTLDEAIETFSKILDQLKKRPRLTPEQRVAQSIFKLAQSDYQARKAALQGEALSLVKTIEIAIGQPFQGKDGFLPQRKNTWPEISELEDTQSFSGSNIRKLRAERKSAQADLSLAQSEAWPNLKVGPTFQTQTQAGISYEAYGLSLTVPLPLYQTNTGGRRFATLGVDKAETSLRTGSDILKNERDREVIQYQASLKALQNASTLYEVEKEHQKVEELFRIGLIQSSLVIEAHRQIVDLTKNVNERELEAIRSLWRIYAIEGRILKERI